MNLVEEDFSSLAEHVLNKELYEESSPVYDEGCSPETEVPFTLLHGENPANFTLCSNGAHLFVLTNYRLFASMEDGFYSVPLGLVECAELRHPADLLILCKDCRSFKLSFETEQQSRLWMDRIHQAIKPKSNFNDVFAFIHYAYKLDIITSRGGGNRALNDGLTSKGASLLTAEYQRMGMYLSEMWRIAECNTKYSVCSSYPKLFIVPRAVTDEDICEVAKFRALGRVPAIVWRHSGNGCVLVRCSQPLVGVLGWRCQEDEKFFDALAQSCNSATTPGPEPVVQRENSAPVTNGHTHICPSPLILDLRSYTAALGNRAKGGGCEHQDYYINCEIQYKGLANIHSVRKSFQSLRNLFSANSLSTNFLSSLESTQWINNLSQLLSTSIEVASAIHMDNRPVVVHCSDGWDRTTQVVALAEIMLDPYYRTFEGFEVLVEREWLSFGHKFSDRCGLGVDSEQSPIFVQWLDCVYQLMRQFPTAFEFNASYLIKLAHHSYSLLCGTFLLNCEQQREQQQISKHTLSVWSLLDRSHNEHLVNILFRVPDQPGVLFPSYFPKDIHVWQELYGSSHMIPYSFSSPTPPPQLPRNSAQAAPSNSSLVNSSSCHSGKQDDQNHSRDGADMEEMKEMLLDSSSQTTIKSDNVAIQSINCNIDDSNNTSGSSSSGGGGCNGDVCSNGHPSEDKDSNCASSSDLPTEEENLQGDTTLVQSNVFYSFNLKVDSSVKSQRNGCTSDNATPSRYFPSCINKEMDIEDSFRVVEDFSQPSLTASNVRNLSDGDPSLTPLSDKDFRDSWSPIVPRLCKMDLSTFSECESRLRNLSEDGMRLHQDPVQERVREMEEHYKERVAHLEDKLKRLTSMLRHKIDSGEGRNEIKEEILEFLSESSDHADQPVSPGNGWTHVDVEDTVGVQWIPDHAVTHCKQCGSEFWLGKRKHHCRNCGGVFCWKCSNYYCPVPHEQLYGNQRVCGRCYDRLDGYLHSVKQHS